MLWIRALAVALAFWNGWPPDCARPIEHHVEPLPDQVLGRAQRFEFYDRTRPDICTVIYDRRRWRDRRALFCFVTVHEIGHLFLGPQHSSDPRSVMYPRLTRWNVPRRCRRM